MIGGDADPPKGKRYKAPKNGVWRLRAGITLRGYQCDDLARQTSVNR